MHNSRLSLFSNYYIFFWVFFVGLAFFGCTQSPSEGNVTLSNDEEAVRLVSVEESDHDSEGASHMEGAQTRNRGMLAVPAPGEVDIDGEFDDWDLSGRISSFADYTMRDEYMVDTALMWDEQYLYVGFDWTDKTPLYNMVDPKSDFRDGWKGDSFSIRLSTDQTLWLTGWHATKTNQEIFHLERWKHLTKRRQFGVEDLHKQISEPNSNKLGQGVEVASKKYDGGYRQEIRIPWKLLYAKKTNIAPGLVFKAGFEYIWGDTSGKVRPRHRYADNLQPGESRLIFFYDAVEVWGDVTLVEKGNVERRIYQPEIERLRGPIEFDVRIPESAERFTVVINDADGTRVRNLIADVSPADYAVGQQEGDYKVRLQWDGRDDHGQPVAQGSYQVRGLWHEGISAVFDVSFYNPGTPPWRTADGSGSWGADHTPPSRVVRSGDSILIGFRYAEGGHGLIALNQEGRKVWGNKRGVVEMAGDEKYTYVLFHAAGGQYKLCRFLTKDGSYVPYVKNGERLPFEVPVNSFVSGIDEIELPDGIRHAVTDIAINNGNLYFLLYGGRLVTVDANNLNPISDVIIDGLQRVASAPNGSLYGVVSDRVAKINPKSGQVASLATPGLKKPGDLDVSSQGKLAVMDAGPDYQVKVYNLDGKFIEALGEKGGRAIRGPFRPEALSHVSSISFDSVGNLWATEQWDYPRRISVWAPDGKLHQEFVGNTGYGGTAGYMHDDDPNLGYVGPIEMKVDRSNNTYQVTEILWVADPDQDDEPKSFTTSAKSHRAARRFRSSAGGVEREFMYAPPTYAAEQPSVLFMEDENGWRPVSAFGYVHQLSGKMNWRRNKVVTPPQGNFSGLHSQDGFFWNDVNDDGQVQRDECIIIPAPDGRKKGTKTWGAIPHTRTDWNNTVRVEDLSLLTGDVYRIYPVAFTKAGAPIYKPEGVKKVLDTKPMDLVAPYEIAQDDMIVALSKRPKQKKGVPGLAGFDSKTKEMKWSYPNKYSGVHGSHRAPMSSPGKLIGPLKVMGHAKVEGVGNVFGIRGNLGQDFYFTSDGLYIGAIFGDSRKLSGSLEPTVEKMKNRILDGQRDEPFSGRFVRQDDGKFRVSTSIAEQAVLVGEVQGLESIQRFVGPKINIGPSAETAILAYTPPSESVDESKELTIPKMPAPPSLENNKGWSKAAKVKLEKRGVPEKAVVLIGYDKANLYLSYKVDDASPMKNEGLDYKRLFKTGDALDLQIGTDDHQNRSNPGKNDTRIVLSILENKPAAILMRPIDGDALPSMGHTYFSPVGTKKFERVEVREDVQLNLERSGSMYTMRASIPWSVLGIDASPGALLAGDIGLISSDNIGSSNIARTYWSNSETGLVSDEPLEAWFKPSHWGKLRLEE